jgi:hypothetical protein
MTATLAAIGFLAAPALAQLAHTGVPARDHVVLEMVAGTRDGCGAGAARVEFTRTFPDATTGELPFRVPTGRLLVVTEVDWFYYDGAPGQSQVLRLLIESLQEAGRKRKVLESIVQLGPAGSGGANVRMTSGFTVSSKARLCVEVSPGPFLSPSRVSNILLRGYLVEDR